MRIFNIIRIFINMKKCSKCGNTKKISDFPFRNKSKGTRHSACNNCQKVIRKESYERNKKTTYERNKRNKDKNIIWFKEYKSSLKCSKCDENHPSCLDFHHIDKSTKKYDVSEMIHGTYSRKLIIEEIEKCVILCANCHRKRHYND